MTCWEDVFVVAAGPRCIRSPAPAGGIDLVVHAPSGRAHRVRPRNEDVRATRVQVFRPADGGLAALHVAARYLSASDGPGTALVTADRTAPPGTHPPRTPAGAVVAKGAGAARVLATVFLGAPPEGALFRGDLPWREPAAHRPSLRPLHRLAARCRRPLPERMPPLGGPEREAVSRAVNEAGASLSDVARVVRTPDQLTALADLLHRGRETGAPLVVLAGAGRGQDFGCAVLKPL
ncbi:hypothetical protein [Streptomyces cyaneofuscatus]|uniref:hypothetical protein n=1 Tax=Streptomyces cyaneofuscatus TaxID=66883 RepID=UPI00386523BD|nr:hypothetical protein OG973_06515 [Streptomyces cyaneofuscatus]